MTLNELKYIVALARERHFGRAAKACFVSQPTLSVAVKKLEHKLGVTLFERRSGEVSVTLMGEKVVAQALQVLADAKVIEEIVKQGDDQLSSPLRIGAIHTVAPYLFPHLIPEMKRIAPDMPLVLEEQYPYALKEDLKHGDLDLAIVSLPFEEQGLLVLPIYQETFVVLLPSAHPLNEKSSLSLVDLAKENVLLLEEGHCFREQVLEICPDCINKIEGAGKVMQQESACSLDTTFYMVASGLGVAVVPGSAAARYSSELVSSKPLEENISGRVIALAWRRSFSRTKALNAVCMALENCQMAGVTKWHEKS